MREIKERINSQSLYYLRRGGEWNSISSKRERERDEKRKRREWNMKIQGKKKKDQRN